MLGLEAQVLALLVTKVEWEREWVLVAISAAVEAMGEARRYARREMAIESALGRDVSGYGGYREQRVAFTSTYDTIKSIARDVLYTYVCFCIV